LKQKKLLVATGIGILAVLTITVLLLTRGNTALNLTVEDTTGRKINFLSLSEQKPVLVVFWASTCKSCIKEMPHLIELYQELHDKGLELIGVAMHYDPPIQVVASISKHGISYPVVMDLNKEIMRAFGMARSVTPASFLIAPGGNIVLQKVGPLDFQQLKQQIISYL